MKDLVLFGAGGSGREIACMVEKINAVEPTWHLLGFVDDDASMWGKKLNGIPVLGGTDWLTRHREHVYCSCTIGLMAPRVAVCEKLKNKGIRFTTLIDPTASIGTDVQIGEGCLINEHCELSVNIRVGRYAFLNSDTSLGHDTVIGDYVICNPNVVISGACRIGDRVMLGGMCFIVQMATIENDAVIAPGSVVYGRVREGNHMLGNPARKVDL